jgi:hypothetical protein
MIEYKEHEGKLFRMLDKPVPLTPDSKLPCLVRLIQDDSPMGRYNNDFNRFDILGNMPLIAQEIKQKSSSYFDALHAYGNKGFCIASIRQLEVIGTLTGCRSVNCNSEGNS